VSTNKRINYACLALAYCGARPIDGVKSVGFSLSRSITNVYGRGSSAPAATYGQLPDVEFSYSSHVTTTTGFPGFQNEPGLTDYVSFDMMIGSDTAPLLTTPIQTLRMSYMLLSSVTYNLAVDGLFSIDRTFKGWNKSANCGQGLGRIAASSGIILNRSAFNSQNSTLPSIVAGSAIQNINVSMNINRSFVGEFATRKPYASYINFPIETTCTIDTIVQNSLENYTFDLLQTACRNGPLYTENLKIATCSNNASIFINQAHLTSFDYSGAEAQQGGSNLKLSLNYTGYQPPIGIKPVIYIDDKDLEDPCSCS
jgi:hypothetical protein